jgi:hypothetical protein
MNVSSPPSRRQAFALAAALTLTVLTAGAAATGLRHAGSQQPAAAPVVQVSPAPIAPVAPEEESD